MKTKTMTDIQKKASDYLEWFEVKTRGNGETYWTMKDGEPEEVQDMVRRAHAGMMPDDYKYDYVTESLEALVSYDDPDDIQGEIEADVYDGALLKWVGSHLNRAGYVEEGVKEFGLDTKDFDLFKVLSMGQYLEKCEVFGIVRSWIENKAEEEL